MTQYYSKLIEKIEVVTRRWRAQRLLRGLAITLGVAVASLYLSVYVGQYFKFSPASVWVLRVLIAATTLAAALRFLVLPLARRISNVQVARYVEERHPELQERLSSAVEMGQTAVDPQKISPALADRLIEDALEKTNRIDVRSLIKSRDLAAFGGLCAAILIAVTLSLLLGPSGLRFGASKLFPLGAQATSLPPNYKIIVTPGNVEIAKGIDLKITARFEGLMPDKVEFFSKDQNAPEWTSQAMAMESESNGFTLTLFNITLSKEYYVGTEQIKSPPYRITVGDLPRLEKITTTYHYPSYTGLPSQTIENDGNLSAVKGTQVDFQAQANQAVTAAKILYNDNSSQPMTVEGQALKARIPVQKNASYVIQVTDARGKTFLASEEFKIEALPDQPPTVSIVKPGRDRKATRLEEVLTEVKAADDFGVAKVELVYAVNGGQEKPVTLFEASKGQGKKNISATHTFFLEEMNLSPGDMVTYYAQARDGEGSKTRMARSDIYFLDITRSDKEFRQAQAAGGQQGGGGNSFRQLVQQQREVIAATWKMVRDKDQFDKKSYSENLRALVLSEGRLKKEAKKLSDELQQRMQVFGEEMLKKLAEFFAQASEKMGEAEGLLTKGSTSGALPPERAALQELLKAESLFKELQVARGNSGAANGNNDRMMDELEELFALEMDKLKNQYETMAQPSGGNRDAKEDEIRRKLKELAERQQKLNENALRQAQQGAPQGGGGGQSMQAQAQLMKEIEDLKRQLERLARDKPERQNGELQSQLDKALSEMRKSMEKMRQNDAAGAASSGARAQQQLDSLHRQMQNTQQGRLSDQLRETRKNVEQMLEQQKQIEKEVNRLDQAGQPGSKGAEAARKRIAGSKSELADQVEQTKNQIDRMAQAQRGSRQKSAAADKLAQARDTLGQEKLADKIREGNDLLSKGQMAEAKQRERAITGSLEKTLRQLKEAEQGVGQSDEEKLAEALTRTRDLIDNLGSLSERMRNNQNAARNQDRAGKGNKSPSSQQPSAQGQKGQKGQPGPEGQDSSEPSAQNNAGQSRNNAAQQNGSQQGQSPGSQQQGQGSQQGQARGAQSGQNSGQPQTGQAQGGSSSPNGQRTQQPLNGVVPGTPNGDSSPPAGVFSGGQSANADPQGRQLERELQERVREAAELAGRIPDREIRSKMEQIIGAMRRLDAQRAPAADSQFFERLRSQILDPLQQLELQLSKKLGMTIAKNKFATMDEDAVPEEYRRLVEQYYKELAERHK